MNRRNILTLSALAALGLAVLPGIALAQQTQHVSFKTPAENAKYTQQLNIDVGDVPKHIIRIFELHRTFPNDAPTIGGVKLMETWARGTANITDGNGTGSIYAVNIMASGDKFFYRYNVLLQAAAGKSDTTLVGFITGGTGKFAGMHGVVRGSSILDFKARTNDNQTEIDYTMAK